MFFLFLLSIFLLLKMKRHMTAVTWHEVIGLEWAGVDQMDDIKEYVNYMTISWCIHGCYDLKLKELSNKTTLVLSNTRELDRVPNTK